MIICDECKGFPVTYFVEMIGDHKQRTLCPYCTPMIAGRYIAKAKRRREDRKRLSPRRKQQEAAQ